MAMNGAGDDLDLDDLDLESLDLDDILLADEEREEHLRTKEKLQETQKKLEAVSVELQNVKQTFEEEKKIWNADLDDLGDLEDFEFDADFKALQTEQESHLKTRKKLEEVITELTALKARLQSHQEESSNTKQTIQTLQSKLTYEIQKAQKAEEKAQSTERGLTEATEIIETLKSRLRAEMQTVQKAEETAQKTDEAFKHATQEIDVLKTNLRSEAEKLQKVTATAQKAVEDLKQATQTIEALQAQLEAAKNSGFIYRIKKAVSFINRPSVITGLTAGAVIALTTTATPLAVVGYGIASLIGVEGFKNGRDKLAARHLQAAEKADQVDSNHPYFVHGQRAEQAWKAYLNPLWVATFLPSFMNSKSKAFQMGREAKRMEIAEAKTKQLHKLS